MKYYKIENYNNIKINNELINFYDPTKCYFVVPSDYRILVKENDYIYKNQIIITNDKDNIFSTISGTCIDIMKIDGKLKVIVENDYKELEEDKKGVYKIPSSYSKKELLDILKPFDYKFYKEIKSNKLKKIIINAIYTEPYDYSSYFLFKDGIFTILESLNAILNTLNIEGTIMISSNYADVINQILSNLGTFPSIKIKILTPYYPLQSDKYLKKHLKIKEDRSLIVSINKLNEISNILKKRKVITEKYITIAGSLVENPAVVNAKLGSRLDELLNLFKITNSKNKVYLLNNRLMAKTIEPKEYFINNDTDLIIISDNVLKEEDNCINCGLCIESCPLKLNPKHQNDACLNCNLCSYVCPANINLKEKRSKNE